ncbi:MAG: hypothetical protein ACKV1O_31020 [Saprospiraceae bacterium]
MNQWNELTKLTLNTRLFTYNQNYDLRCRSAVFQNMGTGNVIINEIYTLLPNATLQLGGTAGHHVIFDRINIQFVTGFTNRLEMMEEQFADIPLYNM